MNPSTGSINSPQAGSGLAGVGRIGRMGHIGQNRGNNIKKLLKISIVLIILSLAELAAFAAPFHFTVTSDLHSNYAVYDAMLAQMKAKIGGQGVFQISPGDIESHAKLRERIDARFGKDAVWFAGIGNHDTGAKKIKWLRNEYINGNGARKPLKSLIKMAGPVGSRETTYSWDYGNAHFIMLNEYWNGGTKPGSDIADDGDIVDALYNWLKSDLAKNKKPVVFIFGHEPAFPKIRHRTDSLNKYPENRDRFWKLLESTPGVKAFICGHTHYYYRLQQPGGRVWQISDGNAGNVSGDGKAFLDVIVSDKQVKFNAWRDGGTGKYIIKDSWSVPVTK